MAHGSEAAISGNRDPSFDRKEPHHLLLCLLATSDTGRAALALIDEVLVVKTENTSLDWSWTGLSLSTFVLLIVLSSASSLYPLMLAMSPRGWTL